MIGKKILPHPSAAETWIFFQAAADEPVASVQLCVKTAPSYFSSKCTDGKKRRNYLLLQGSSRNYPSWKMVMWSLSCCSQATVTHVLTYWTYNSSTCIQLIQSTRKTNTLFKLVIWLKPTQAGAIFLYLSFLFLPLHYTIVGWKTAAR